MDILSASRFDDKVAWYQSNGAASSPSFTMRLITTTADGAYSVATADLDGDHDLDVISASDNDDSVRWYENLGGASPEFKTHIITSTADKARSVAAADMDGDHDVDALSASNGYCMV